MYTVYTSVTMRHVLCMQQHYIAFCWQALEMHVFVHRCVTVAGMSFIAS